MIVYIFFANYNLLEICLYISLEYKWFTICISKTELNYTAYDTRRFRTRFAIARQSIE